MKYDFSALQRAEDRWREDFEAAARYRLAKGLGHADRKPSALGGLLSRLRQAVRGRQAGGKPTPDAAGSGGSAKGSAVITGAIALLIVSSAAPAGAASPAQAPSPAETVRSVAESVLGPRTVKSVRLADDGRTVLIRWESATYRPDVSRAEMREILYGEALLTTSAVLGSVRRVVRIRFSMLYGTRMVATGDNWRGRGLRLMFGLELGGGVYVPPAQEGPAPAKPAGSSLQTQ